ncbi:FHA domain-containing protein [Leisingera aquaemixtae]|uniref:FHA domain-containing protein n=1 Tax=Leisingera aquaemixtae TaxID=1396826 RepID=UPI0021BD6E4B|nr:FHA domain-containing protein [Leisingera aquaemixtae]
MKFIKDIIGEKRERVRMDAPAAEPVQPPPQDPFASLTGGAEAAAGSGGAPLSLDRGFLLDPDPEEDTAEEFFLPEDFLEDSPADSDEEDTEAAADLQDMAEDITGSLDTGAPEEDAIAAFFAREQAPAPAAAPQAAPEPGQEPAQPDTLDGFGAAAEEPEQEAYAPEDAYAAGEDENGGYLPEDEEDFQDTFEAEADFGRLQQPEAAAERPGGYRIFRRNAVRGAGEPETAPDGPAEAPEAAAPQPEAVSAAEDGLSGSTRPAAQPAPQTAWQPDPQAAAEAPQPAAPQAPPAAAAPIDVPAPSMGRGASRAGRVKTRLLGFSPAQAPGSDPFSRSAEGAAPGYTQFPVGWLAVVQGPGRGAAFTLFSGVSVIGRGEDQTVRLDFGDNSISRDNHAAIAYDPEQKSFYIGHGGKANLVRRNGRPVLSTEELAAGDVIRIGETTLRFVPLCGADFGWDQPQQRDGSHAAFS